MDIFRKTTTVLCSFEILTTKGKIEVYLHYKNIKILNCNFLFFSFHRVKEARFTHYYGSHKPLVSYTTGKQPITLVFSASKHFINVTAD